MMVHVLHLYGTFLVCRPLRPLYKTWHIRPFAHPLIGSNLGLTILPKGTSTCRLERPGNEPVVAGLYTEKNLLTVTFKVYPLENVAALG